MNSRLKSLCNRVVVVAVVVVAVVAAAVVVVAVVVAAVVVAVVVAAVVVAVVVVTEYHNCVQYSMIEGNFVVQEFATTTNYTIIFSFRRCCHYR